MKKRTVKEALHGDCAKVVGDFGRPYSMDEPYDRMLAESLCGIGHDPVAIGRAYHRKRLRELGIRS